MGMVALLAPSHGAHAQNGPKGALHAEDIPHLPNFLGKNICLGIEAPATRPGWAHPEIHVKTKLGSDSAYYEIIFSKRSAISVWENVVSRKACAHLPVNKVAWHADGHADFCMAMWDVADKYVRVRFKTKSSGKKDHRDLMSSLYSVGSCKLGSDGYYQYGDVLKVGSSHIYSQL